MLCGTFFFPGEAKYRSRNFASRNRFHRLRLTKGEDNGKQTEEGKENKEENLGSE